MESHLNQTSSRSVGQPTFRNNPGGMQLGSSSFSLHSNLNGASASPAASRSQTLGQSAPPVPPRPTSTVYNRMGIGYNSFMPYNRFSTSPYSSYGGLSYGNRFGYSQTPWDVGGVESTFIRLAEESSRPAFQSIESIVSAVSSISMMLESTYHAVYSSYRAVLGVVENFSRLRNHLAHVLSALTLIRSLYWLCLKFLYILGMRKTNPSVDVAWSAASELAAKDDAAVDVDPPESSWPIFMFLGLVFGAPWIIFRIFSKIVEKKSKESNQWTKGKENQYTAVALFDFEAGAPGELSIHAGQQMILAPKNLQPKVRGWVLGTVDGKKTGLVPANYIKVLPLKQVKPSPLVPVQPTTSTTEME